MKIMFSLFVHVLHQLVKTSYNTKLIYLFVVCLSAFPL